MSEREGKGEWERGIEGERGGRWRRGVEEEDVAKERVQLRDLKCVCSLYSQLTVCE